MEGMKIELKLDEHLCRMLTSAIQEIGNTGSPAVKISFEFDSNKIPMVEAKDGGYKASDIYTYEVVPKSVLIDVR